MVVKRGELKTYRYLLFCEQCGSEMRRGGVIRNWSPPDVLHECTGKRCDNITWVAGKSYPYDSHEFITDLVEVIEES